MFGTQLAIYNSDWEGRKVGKVMLFNIMSWFKYTAISDFLQGIAVYTT